MDSLAEALLLALLAGAAIPLGAHLASVESIRPAWLEEEFRHSIIAFGGGVLLAAVSLVLVPEGIRELSLFWIVVSFAAGGIAFFLLDRLVARLSGSVSQLMAMLLDFIPEALSLGAALATGQPIGVLLACLIALQNLPEGFNSYRELSAGGRHSSRMILAVFWLIAFVGPLSAYVGYEFLSASPSLLGAIMLAAASGIIYLTFKDIAPQAELKARWAPQLGAVFGFLLGLVGHVLLI
jgi:ZIP family zinc transporter